jgi:hypothetical protein
LVPSSAPLPPEKSDTARTTCKAIGMRPLTFASLLSTVAICAHCSSGGGGTLIDDGGTSSETGANDGAVRDDGGSTPHDGGGDIATSADSGPQGEGGTGCTTGDPQSDEACSSAGKPTHSEYCKGPGTGCSSVTAPSGCVFLSQGCTELECNCMFCCP